jgi:hypothetical protein
MRKGGFISKIRLVFIVLVIFMLGWAANNTYSFFTNLNKEQPFSFSSNEIKSPGDWIKETDVKIRNNAVTLLVENATWSTFIDTNSMDPVIDVKSHAIKVVPKNPSELSIGDIVSYNSEAASGIVIHRIVEKGIDEQGVFFITKGDNNKNADLQKVRFDQITGVVVAILY